MRAPEPGAFEHLLQPVDVPVQRLVRSVAATGYAGVVGQGSQRPLR
jgi:hypothetical protein